MGTLTLSLPRVTLIIDFALPNAGRFYSSKGDPLGVKGLITIQIDFIYLLFSCRGLFMWL